MEGWVGGDEAFGGTEAWAWLRTDQAQRVEGLMTTEPLLDRRRLEVRKQCSAPGGGQVPPVSLTPAAAVRRA